MKRTQKDELYINSTSFEVYMAAGAVWLFGFTLSFILSVVSHHETWLWPGALLSVVLGFVVLKVLGRRERLSKIREVDGE